MFTKRLNTVASSLTGILALAGVAGVLLAIIACRWNAAAVLLAGLITAGVVWWQGSLLKRELAFSTLIEIDKEWNSPEMLQTRQRVRDSGNRWNVSRLEGVLEFFEKLASFTAAGVLDVDLVHRSTLGWYATRYYLFARDEIERVRKEVWKDHVYGDLQDLYEKYLTLEVGKHLPDRKQWETKQKQTESTFWREEGKE